MSGNIQLNSLVREAKPFWPDRPFINPDKAIVKRETQFRREKKDVFSLSRAEPIDFRGFKISMLKLKTQYNPAGKAP